MALGLDDYGSGSGSESEQELPAVKKRPKRKFAITLPSIAKDIDDSLPPPPKKPRVDSSSLFSMLPPPVQLAPPPETTPAPPPMVVPAQVLARAPPAPSLPTIDFFALDSPTPPPQPSASSSSSSSAPSSLSAAPHIPTYQPPDPLPTDSYPGYYQLPSGKWAAHDPQVYSRFLKKWQSEYNTQLKSMEKSQLADSQAGGATEVDAMKESEKMRKLYAETEERKKLTQVSEASQPKMTITASKTSGIARSRHQLGTMLMQAYENREALEAKIAEGRRNRKEAGAKYGF